MHNKVRDIAIILLVTVACAIPFLRQPFHMDDNFYMDMARHAQVQPLFPNDIPYSLQGEHIPDMGSHSHPPLQTYFLAAVMRLFGEGPGAEPVYHTIALIYPAIACICFYFLSARFVQRPLWPALLLACSPLFMVMQHTLMTDIPMLAFWIAAICCYLYASDTNNPRLYGLSSLFQTAAMFTSYQSFALIPLLGFYQLRRGRGKMGWFALIPGPLFMLGWLTLNYFHYHRMILGGTIGFVQSKNSWALQSFLTKLIAIFQYQGWLVIFPLFIFYVYGRKLRWRALLLSLLGGLFIAQFAVPEYRVLDKGIFIVGLASGFFVVGEMGLFLWRAFWGRNSDSGWDGVDAQFLSLWFFGVLTYCLVIFTEGSARYVLPLIPPFIIFYFRQLQFSETAEYRLPPRVLNSGMVASGTVVLSLAWALMLSHADQAFAGIYPKAAREISQLTGNRESYCTGEWGFRYYFTQKGIHPLPADISAVQGGNYVISPKLALPYELPADLRSMTLPVQKYAYDVGTRLRTLDWQTPAGFYSTGWGLIPFSISRGALEQVDVVQVSFMAERLPWAQLETVTGIKPWPGYLSLEEKSPLAVIAKPGTLLRYAWPIRDRVFMEVQCGISADSYKEGLDTKFEFSIHQLDRQGGILARQDIVLYPGLRPEDRKWQPVRLALMPDPGSVIEFRYRSDDKELQGTGAFAQSLLRPE